MQAIQDSKDNELPVALATGPGEIVWEGFSPILIFPYCFALQNCKPDVPSRYRVIIFNHNESILSKLRIGFVPIY